MKKIVLVAIFSLAPMLISAYTADDFTVNDQSTYAVAPGSVNVLILDLTLPEAIDSIKIENEGTAQQYNISQLTVFEDGESPGWDGDEAELIRESSSPFFGVELEFPKSSGERIFVTVSIDSDTVTDRTVKPKAVIDDVSIVGFERTISTEAGLPQVPVAPIAQTPEAISSSAIRWHFTDISNNEFGFKILDGNLKEVARVETADISYVDETGLEPDTEYSGRRIVAFNDRGESLSSPLTVFPTVRTLAEAVAKPEETAEEEAVAEEETVEEEKVVEEPSLFETIQQKIAEFQQQVDELFDKLAELLAEQGATVWTAFQRFFQSLLGR